MLQQVTVRKTITLPENLVKILEDKAMLLGFKFPEFVRLVLANEALADAGELTRLTKDEGEQLEKAEADFAEGRFITFTNAEEMNKYLDKLAAEK